MEAKNKEELIGLLDKHYYVWFNGLRYRKISQIQFEVCEPFTNDTGEGVSFDCNLGEISSL